VVGQFREQPGEGVGTTWGLESGAVGHKAR